MNADLAQAIEIYRKKAHDYEARDLDFENGRFTVRIWDGMDGCWSDLDEATDVDGKTALRVWLSRTDNGTKKISFDEIDYYRIFPADTRMKWDGTEGREMFR